MTAHNVIALIPHYNHANKIEAVIKQLLAFDLPVLVVDDGSTAEQRQQLAQIAQRLYITVVLRAQNGGKGAAVKTGLQWAFEQGFSHAVQVDADGQHHLADIETMLVKSRQNPTALICGKPIYGDDAPKARLYGRKITNFWIAINTLSLKVEDGMCGFRLYPLATVVPILNQEKLGDRMDFDIEILIHCQWRKIPLVWVDTPVKYEAGGVSHFRGWADNWLISKMHARLFFGMLGRVLTGKF
ncbi:glycosyltransferase family 2 protein [Actinobacillus vicugnae]|uniref:glycosyltransferase family 2 protein n=1 Tax=Actinobacillus vicugnae TaxID=2573093 RepID=UPI00123F20B9|nr:glycosyltransferase family 2 protein [Actinobacillus vicugnae]